MKNGHAERYPNLKVNYIDHHNPDLFLFDADGEEMNRIDLTRVKTLNNMHKLMKLLGMRETCRDDNASCDEWAKGGQCAANPAFMHESCRRACGICSSDGAADAEGSGVLCVNTAAEHDCEYWSTLGECTKNEAFMRGGCARSCGFCEAKEAAAAEDDDDDDLSGFEPHDEL